jgi:hypothetical protein
MPADAALIRCIQYSLELRTAELFDCKYYRMSWRAREAESVAPA